MVGEGYALFSQMVTVVLSVKLKFLLFQTNSLPTKGPLQLTVGR